MWQSARSASVEQGLHTWTNFARPHVWRIQTQIWKKTAPPRFDSYAGRRLGSQVFKVCKAFKSQ